VSRPSIEKGRAPANTGFCGRLARVDDVAPLPVQEAEIQRLKATASQYGMKLARVD